MRIVHPAVGEDEDESPRRGRPPLVPGAKRVLRRKFSPLPEAQERIRLRFKLTLTEWCIAMMWLTGDASAKTTANALDLSNRTVEIHSANIIAKIKTAAKIEGAFTKIQAALTLDRALRPFHLRPMRLRPHRMPSRPSRAPTHNGTGA